MKNEKKSSFESGLNKDKILSLIEELGIKLPDIPIQSEDLFFESLLKKYEEEINSIVREAEDYFKILTELSSSPELIGLVTSDLNQTKALDILIQQKKGGLLEKSIKGVESEIKVFTDTLTQLWSRAAFNEILKRNHAWIARSEPFWERKNIPKKIILVCLIDLDNFKGVNDSYGHPFGDKFLKQIATTLNDAIKQETDSAFRIGGDEFALIVQIDENDLMEYGDTIDEAILKFSQKIHSRISGNEFEIEHNGNTIKIKSTVSMGVKRMTPDKTIEDTQISADANLYKAKETGKNEIVA